MIAEQIQTRCLECRKPITQEGCLPGGFGRRYCGKGCSRRAHERRRGERKKSRRSKRQCRGCDEVLPASYPNRLYCHAGCERKSRARQARRRAPEHKHLCHFCDRPMCYCGRLHVFCSLACCGHRSAVNGWQKTHSDLLHTMTYAAYQADRPRCKGCGIPLWAHNTTGYCWENLKCRQDGAAIRMTPEQQERRNDLKTLDNRARGRKPLVLTYVLVRCATCLKEIGRCRPGNEPKRNRHCEEHSPRCVVCRKITYAKDGTCSQHCRHVRSVEGLKACVSCGLPTRSKYSVCSAPECKPLQLRMFNEERQRQEVRSLLQAV